uniref:Penicillin-binding protein n=1 Tax=Meloidogyne hapla TaxID=6305 RepID=A0A1I8BGP6_MELHA
MSIRQDIFLLFKYTKIKIIGLVLLLIIFYLLMLKLLIHEKIYIYYTSQRVQVTEKGTKRILRIAQIAPPEISVPPKTYGGIERTISYLTEEQVRRGHKVS